MKISDIQRRKSYLSLASIPITEQSHIVKDISNEVLNEDEIKTVVKGWKTLNTDEVFALIETMNILKKHLDKYKQNKNFVLNILKEQILPSVKNLNKFHSIVLENFQGYDLSEINEEIRLYKGCDRVLKNQKVLNKKGFNESFNKFNPIMKDCNISDYIENAFSIIDSMNLPLPVKYNLALENTLYEINQRFIKCDPKDILEEATSYFLMRDFDEKDLNKIKSIVTESPLYENIDKSGILYIFEDKKLDLDAYGIPQEKKYPMPDAKHVLSAIKFFNYVKPEYEKQLADNINKKIKKFGIKNINVGKKNRFSNYYECEVVQETSEPLKKKCLFCEQKFDVVLLEKHIKSCHSEQAKKYPRYVKDFIESMLKENCKKPVKVKAVKEQFKPINLNKSIIIEEMKKFDARPIKKILDGFTLTKVKTKNGLNKLINKIFTQSTDNIIEEVPDVLGFFRRIIVVGLGVTAPIPIGVVIIAVGLFTNKLIESKLRKEQMEKVVKNYKKELDKVETKIYSIDDDKKKEKLILYKKQLSKSVYTLENYRDKLYSQKELDDRWEKEYMESTNFLENANKAPFKYEPLLLENYFKYNHQKMIIEIYQALEILNVILTNNPKYEKLVKNDIIQIASSNYFHNFESMNDKSIESFMHNGRVGVTLAYFYPGKYSKKEVISTEEGEKIIDTLCEICENVQDGVDTDYIVYFHGSDEVYTVVFEFKNAILTDSATEAQIVIDQISTLSILDEELLRLKPSNIKSAINSLYENLTYDNIKDITTIFKENCEYINKEEVVSQYKRIADEIYTDTLSEAEFKRSLNDSIKELNEATVNEYIDGKTLCARLNAFNEGIDAINELGVGSTAKLAVNKVTKSAKILSDKQKQLSKSLDDKIEDLDKSIRRDISDKNREKIIKGRILPKASNIIKYGIAAAAGFATFPTITAISLLGGIGVSKIGSKREKQFILDEIEIQLKLVERKIQLAENNNDMKSLEELFKIEKKLKREKQRIMYNMKAYYPVSANN